MKTIVFIDGYNLYYGLLRRSPYKWLDLYALFQHHVLQNADVSEIRYYTAPVLARMSDDVDSPKRQRTYLQALRKHQPHKVTIIEGKMVAATPFSRLVKPIAEAPTLDKVQVYRFEEKQSDVNMAVDMVVSALTNRCEQIVLCSNDSVSIKQCAPHIRLGLVTPIRNESARAVSKDLSQYADWSKVLSQIHLANSQLPAKIPSTAILKPDRW
ncbi:MAG: NYN domain-containing protein [Moraxellaceae bacterium]|nr:NYN domain-containing protein [Moraxellaceae bacterium]